MKKTITYLLLVLFLLLPSTVQNSLACTRIVYKGLNGLVLTARSMDWQEDLPTNLWIFPRNMERNGEVGPNSLKWKSKYGSVIASGYEISTTDGMNEKGLVANVLWLVESEYPEWDQKKPGLTIAAWCQYALDNFATVSEAVNELKQEKFTLVTDKVPGMDKLATLHLSLSDASGDSAIFEYVKGKLVIHHDPKYNVMTNSPIFDEQLALNEYWKALGGTVMLPGTNRAADRFARASFYIDAIPKTDDQRIAVASTFSVIRNCSVPYGISTPNEPNISSTRWRTVADHKNLVYYFESTLTPDTFWVNFKDIDFSSKGEVKKLTISNGETYSGNTAKSFIKTAPFKFLGL